MNSNRLFTLILGIFMVGTGIFCLVNPAMTYMTFAYIIGLSMIVESIGGIIIWNERKKAGEANGWALAGSIISLIFGIALIGSAALQFAVDMTLIYFAAAWLVILGIIRIVVANKIRTGNVPPESGLLGRRWGLVMLVGVLLVVCGVLSFFNPTGLIVALGIQFGLTITIVGISMIANAA